MKIYSVAASQLFYEDLWLPIDTRLRRRLRLRLRLRSSVPSGRGEIEIEFPCETVNTQDAAGH